MAVTCAKAVGYLQSHSRHILQTNANRTRWTVFPIATQCAHLTSTHGQPAQREYKPWPYEKRRYNEFYQFFDLTRKRLEENSKVILIEGNLAVGKSSFGEKMAKEFDMKFFPDLLDKELFITGENFDLRTLNERLPARARFCDLETFYTHKAPHDMLESFPRTLLSLFRNQVFRYARALEHLLNTGQGVVVERGAFSSMVFNTALHKTGHISAAALKFLNFVYDNTLCELWHPHLVVYLDAPVSHVRSLINKRNTAWEVKSPVITDEFLSAIEKAYNEKYLPRMKKYGNVLTIDVSDLPDWEIIVEDLESQDLESFDFDDEFRLSGWRAELEDDFQMQRLFVSCTEKLERLFTMALPLDAPEFGYHNDDALLLRNIIDRNPEVAYLPGYNPEKYNVWLKW